MHMVKGRLCVCVGTSVRTVLTTFTICVIQLYIILRIEVINGNSKIYGAGTKPKCSYGQVQTTVYNYI